VQEEYSCGQISVSSGAFGRYSIGCPIRASRGALENVLTLKSPRIEGGGGRQDIGSEDHPAIAKRLSVSGTTRMRQSLQSLAFFERDRRHRPAAI